MLKGAAKQKGKRKSKRKKEMGASSHDIARAIQQVSDRVQRLQHEKQWQSSSIREKNEAKTPQQSQDELGLKMLVLALSEGFTDTRFVRCASNYYEQPLEARRRFLNAPHVRHMTKSIVLQNARNNNQYICCVLPYARKVDHERIKSLYGSIFVVAEDCLRVTGYVPNAVTPLGLKTKMDVVIERGIVELDASWFWLGGGDISLKWRVTVEDFCRAFQPNIADICVPE